MNHTSGIKRTRNTAIAITNKETPSIFDFLYININKKAMGPEEEKVRKKKRSKSKKIKKPKKSQSLNSYVRVGVDEEKALGTSSGHGEPKLVVPYPEVEESPGLTLNGNSLPNVPMVHARPNKLLNTCRARTQNCFSCNACICILFTLIFAFSIFFAGVTYEDHHILEQYPLANETGIGGELYGNSTDAYRPGQITYSQHQKDIILKMRELSGSVISEPNTPHHFAAHWMLWDDKSGITADSPYLLERYTAVLFYYKMGKGADFKLDVNSNVCEWDRIECDEGGHSRFLLFDDCDIRGPIPSLEIQALSRLKYLDLRNNKLTGVIPAGLGGLNNLNELLLENNQLTGTMPPQICTQHSVGILTTLTADCKGGTKKITCECCNNCQNVQLDLQSDLAPDKLKVLKKIKDLSGDEVIDNQETPQHKAAQWILNKDYMITADSDNLFQRYALAVLYFMMDGDAEKCFKLEAGVSECSWESKPVDGVVWERVECDETKQHVKYLKLDDCHMRGPIPSVELQKLPDLSYLDLSENFLSGAIPSTLQNMENLDHLYLEENNIKGTVPDEICTRRKDGKYLTNFSTDCKSANLKVQCRCCSNCPIVVDTNISGNSEGNLNGLDVRQSAIFEKLKEISEYVDEADSPQFRAASWIMKEDDMKLNADSDNLYQRYVLVLFRELGDATCFDLQSKENECKWSTKGTDGVTRERIGCNSQTGLVDTLQLDGCNISGSIPPEIKVLSKLEFLDLSKNKFSGEVDGKIFEEFQYLETLHLENNELEGNIPEEICFLEKSKLLDVLSADCGSDGSTANSVNKISCKCCTNCPTGIDNRSIQLMQRFKEVSGDKLSLVGSAQHKAANWIAQEDEMELTSSSDKLYQRYVLAILYFMAGDKNWFGSENSNQNECEWEHVKCNNNKQVIQIQFGMSDLNGHIPPEISVLKELKMLDLRNNNLSGTIPSELSLTSLPKLETIRLDGNDISGSVPNGLCTHYNNVAGLKEFSVDCSGVDCECCDNCKSSDGKILSQAEEAKERNAKIEEVIYEISPVAKTDPSSPQYLALQWMKKKDKLHHIVVSVNSPRFVQRYVLVLIYYSVGGQVWENSLFSVEQDRQNECLVPGVKCDEGDLITALEFSNTGMNGILPSEMRYLSELTRIDFSNNNIVGEVPQSWKGLTKLAYLNLSNNDLSGDVPPTVCDLQSRNDGNFEVDCHKVTCSCCSNCPDP